MSHFVGLAIESLVAVLLLFTIGYCTILNARLKRLRSDEQSLRSMIGELMTATETAERAIGGLKLTVRECDENLGRQLSSGEELAVRLQSQIDSGENILSRLAMIARAARPADADRAIADHSAASNKPSVKALLAAAQAFSERKREHGLAA